MKSLNTDTAPQPARDSAASDLARGDTGVAYGRYAAELLRYATSLTRRADAAHDAVQETLLRYFIERRYGRVIEGPRAWLHQVLRNHCLQLAQEAAVELEAQSALENLADERPDPERALQTKEMGREVAAALTARELDCFRLRAGGLRHAEIGGPASEPGVSGLLVSV
jgi:DNA-directed RNA polymerase specialized sigma24 family protein